MNLIPFTPEQLTTALQAGLNGKGLVTANGQAFDLGNVDVGSITQGLNNAIQAGLESVGNYIG